MCIFSDLLVYSYVDISTHAPRTGSDSRGTFTRDFFNKFQPTLPARGATVKRSVIVSLQAISTHAPRTGSDFARTYTRECPLISTHAPRTGSDIRY